MALSGDVASRPEAAAATLAAVYGRRAGAVADYLARILLSYDDFSKRWWRAQKSKDYDESYLRFVASLELSLVRAWESRGEAGADVAAKLRGRLPPGTARRHLAVALSLIEGERQPTAEIGALLRETERRDVVSVTIVDRGAGYAPNATLDVSIATGGLVGSARIDADGRVADVELTPTIGAGDINVEGVSERPSVLSVKAVVEPFAFVPRGRFFSKDANFDATPVLRGGRYSAPAALGDPTFDVSSFVEKDEEPTPLQFGQIALCGAVCASSAHVALTPVEMVKTQAQLGTRGRLDAVAYFAGVDAIAVGYFLAGATGFGLTAFLRSSLGNLVLASLVASVASTLVVAPFESARVQCMARPNDRLRLPDAWPEPDRALGAIDALLLKDLSFAVVKFSAFDVVTAAVYDNYPLLKESLSTSLLASLVAGCVAGVAAALVSQPVDAAFTRIEAEEASPKPTVFQALAAVYRDAGLFGGLYAGAAERAAFAGALLALEFVIFEGLKSVFHLAKDDFAYSLDVLASATAALRTPDPL